jgi:mRNA interferase MazF
VNRGDLVTVALQGDYGKPRPALIVQSDLYRDRPTITVLPLTSDIRIPSVVRFSVEPTPGNGLMTVSQVMVDKAYTVPREKLGPRIGRLDDDQMAAINRALALFLGLV